MDARSLIPGGRGMVLGTLTLERHPLLWSAITSMVLFVVVGMTADASNAWGSHPAFSWVVTAVVYLVMIAVRRFPVTAAAVATIGSVVQMADGMRYPVTLPAVFVTLYMVALTRGNLRTVLTGVPVKAALLITALIIYPGFTGFTVLLWAALAVALGKAVRSHRAYVAEAEDRARRAEQAKEDEANRRVAEERLRIARELHDVIGHHVALISVQAGALSCLLEEDQAEARESVTHIQQASADALEDLRLTVGLLREPGDGEQADSPPVDPLPGLSRLDDLVGSFAGAGLTVTREVTGRPRPLPEAADLTAYRVIQESLTNVRKHAVCATASLHLGYTARALRLTIENDGHGASSTGPAGHGIIGMRERVAAVGGRLSAGPRPGGGYRVLAELPLSPPEDESPAGDERAPGLMAAPAEVS
jgi:signal transduction histidine kinase